MPRNKDLLRNPPKGVLGSLDPTDPSNRVQDRQTGETVDREIEDMGGCTLIAIMNSTDPLDPRKEKELRFACRTSADSVKAGLKPFKKEQAKDLLFRYYTLALSRKFVSLFADRLCDAEDYLVAYIGGDEVAAQFRSIWDIKPKEDPKETERKRREDELLKKIEAEDAEEVKEEALAAA